MKVKIFFLHLIKIGQHKSGLLSFIFLTLLILLYIFSLLFSWGPYEKNMDALLKPPDINHLFGTDRMGRDQLSRVILAIPVAFYLPILSVFISLVIGSLMGILAGYYGSYCERILMWFNDILLAVPALLLAIFIVGVFGNGIINTAIAISLIYIPRFGRIARGSTRSIINYAFIDSAKLSNVSDFTIFFRHVIPNIFPELLVMAMISFSTALVAQSALSFLGLGIIPPTPDLGNMIAKSIKLVSIAPWMLLCPAIVLSMIIMFFNLFGDAIRDLYDPKISSYV